MVFFEDVATIVAGGRADSDIGFGTRAAFFAEQFKGRPLESITTEDINNAVDILKQRGKLTVNRATRGNWHTVRAGKPLSGATINRYIATVGSIYADAKKLGLIKRAHKSPVPGVEREAVNPGRTVEITVPAAMRLLAAARLSRNRKLAALVALGITTGLRLGSLQTKLHWENVDFPGESIYIRTTKNGAPIRCPLLLMAADELRKLRTSDSRPGDLVFDRHNVMKALRTALGLAGLPVEWGFHHLRHIAASVMAQSGASVPVIMATLGHKSPAMALRYSHLNISTTRSAMEAAWSLK